MLGVSEVLARTGGFTTRVLLRRLMETFQRLLQVTYSLEDIQPGGEAWISTVKVRLLHASVRQTIMRLSETRPDYFNIQELGVPANTLDSSHSICTSGHAVVCYVHVHREFADTGPPFGHIRCKSFVSPAACHGYQAN